MKAVLVILLAAAACATKPSMGSRCYSHEDCRAASLYCSNTSHGGAQPAEPPPPPPSCDRNADCTGDDARCIHGVCTRPGKCEQARP